MPIRTEPSLKRWTRWGRYARCPDKNGFWTAVTCDELDKTVMDASIWSVEDGFSILHVNAQPHCTAVDRLCDKNGGLDVCVIHCTQPTFWRQTSFSLILTKYLAGNKSTNTLESVKVKSLLASVVSRPLSQYKVPRPFFCSVNGVGCYKSCLFRCWCRLLLKIELCCWLKC